jgi:aspartate--ammonia ligase
MADKKADLAGPGISTYEEVDKILPTNYHSVLDPKETQIAITAVKRYIEDGLCRELNLFRVEVPLIVSKDSGVNDYLDRDGSRTPIEFQCGLGLPKRIETQVVQAATKWKRLALKQFGCKVGEGIVTDMRAVRKDYFLDHDHSAYVDQWDWEKVMTSQ